MEHGKTLFDEAQLASMLRQEILNNSQSLIQASPKQKDLSNFELISTQKQPYISPIMTMNEDEILAFVEEFDVNELATLSVAELNRIGEVLGVEPNILLGMKD
ncbi:MAG: hypothetical protein IKL52_00570 [Candidatus Gastranaerophilales bacterium]|nr:hypothetical protein [Candidatus Gastranaerophilales bacterium]